MHRVWTGGLAVAAMLVAALMVSAGRGTMATAWRTHQVIGQGVHVNNMRGGSARQRGMSAMPAPELSASRGGVQRDGGLRQPSAAVGSGGHMTLQEVTALACAVIMNCTTRRSPLVPPVLTRNPTDWLSSRLWHGQAPFHLPPSAPEAVEGAQEGDDAEGAAPAATGVRGQSGMLRQVALHSAPGWQTAQTPGQFRVQLLQAAAGTRERPQGYSHAEVMSLMAAMDFSQPLGASMRRGGRSFWTHSVGTASVLLALGSPPDMVAAALLHSAYAFASLPDELMPSDGSQVSLKLQCAQRRYVAGGVGSTAEAYVWAVATFPSSDFDRTATRVMHEALNRGLLRPWQVRVWTMHLANELDEVLPGEGLFSTGRRRDFEEQYRNLVTAALLAPRLTGPLADSYASYNQLYDASPGSPMSSSRTRKDIPAATTRRFTALAGAMTTDRAPMHKSVVLRQWSAELRAPGAGPALLDGWNSTVWLDKMNVCCAHGGPCFDDFEQLEA
jgi:hypothetical protein